MLTGTAPPRRPRTPDPDALFEEAREHRRHRRLKLGAVAAAVLATGAGAYAVLGGGASDPSTVPVLRNGVLTSVPQHTVVLLVDVSGSMRATDVQPTRLKATVAAMQTFLDQLPKRFEVGVVTFSSTAEVVQAPTRDRRLVLQALASLSPQAGTGLGDGLAAAVKLTVDSLARQGIRRAPGHDLPAVIVLQSDGASNRGTVTPLQAAHRAEAAGLRVDGVSLGTPGGTVRFGLRQYATSVPVPPDPKTVAQIAHVTGGESFTAPTANRLNAIYSRLGSTIGQ
jgi:Ca-activated chloride channel family protein